MYIVLFFAEAIKTVERARRVFTSSSHPPAPLPPLQKLLERGIGGEVRLKALPSCSLRIFCIGLPVLKACL